MSAVTRFWHPVADMHAVAGSPASSSSSAAKERHVWDDAGQPLHRRDGRALVRQRRLRPRRDRRRGRGADAEAPRLLPLRRRLEPAHDRPRRAHLRLRADGRTPPSSSRAAAASRSRPSSSSCAATGASLDEPDRTVIISRERAYHGLAGYGTSIVGTEAFKVGVGPLGGRHGHALPGTPPRRSRQRSPRSEPSASRRSSASRSSAPAGVLLPPDGLPAGGAAGLPRRTASSSSPTR